MRLDTEPDKTFIPIRWLTGPSLTCSGDHVGSLDFHPHLAVRRSSYLLPGVQRGLVESEYFHHLQTVESCLPSVMVPVEATWRMALTPFSARGLSMKVVGRATDNKLLPHLWYHWRLSGEPGLIPHFVITRWHLPTFLCWTRAIQNPPA